MTVALAPRDDARSINDIEAGDCVRRYGRVGFVDSDPAHGFVWVAWKSGRRDYLPVAALKRVEAGGSEYDVRKP